jgi:predicted RNase H-like nuclease (RuvC/YqgF family)
MNMDIVTPIIAVVTSLLGGGGFIVALMERKKRRAAVKFQESQTEMNYQTMAANWIDRLESRVKELEQEVDKLRKTVYEYEDAIHNLTSRLKELGHADTIPG